MISNNVMTSPPVIQNGGNKNKQRRRNRKAFRNQKQNQVAKTNKQIKRLEKKINKNMSAPKAQISGFADVKQALDYRQMSFASEAYMACVFDPSDYQARGLLTNQKTTVGSFTQRVSYLSSLGNCWFYFTPWALTASNWFQFVDSASATTSPTTGYTSVASSISSTLATNAYVARATGVELRIVPTGPALTQQGSMLCGVYQTITSSSISSTAITFTDTIISQADGVVQGDAISSYVYHYVPADGGVAAMNATSTLNTPYGFSPVLLGHLACASGVQYEFFFTVRFEFAPAASQKPYFTVAPAESRLDTIEELGIAINKYPALLLGTLGEYQKELILQLSNRKIPKTAVNCMYSGSSGAGGLGVQFSEQVEDMDSPPINRSRVRTLLKGTKDLLCNYEPTGLGYKMGVCDRPAMMLRPDSNLSDNLFLEQNY
jgi:hypothetical protein